MLTHLLALKYCYMCSIAYPHSYSMKHRDLPPRQNATRGPAGLGSLHLRLGRSSNCLGIFFLLLFVATTALAGTEVLYPVEEGYIQGGTHAEQVMDGGKRLLVAARAQTTKENTRKIFLLFETLSDGNGVNSATLKLTRAKEVANKSEVRVPIDLLLFGAPGGDWTGPTLTWASAPFHNPDSFSDEGTSGLKLLAKISVDTSEAKEFALVEFSDPRLTEFLRKNRGRVTLVVTSAAASQSPGLWLLGAKSTSKPERRPQLVLEMK